MKKRRVGDFLLAAAGAALSVWTGGLTGAAAWQAFAARTALVLGVQTYSRSQQRKAQRRAARGPQDNTVTLRTNEYPEQLIFGTTRVPTMLDYRCNHGARKEFLSAVFIVPCRHELTAIDGVLFDGVSIGPLDANGYVTSGSRWFTDTVSMKGHTVDGGSAGLTITMPVAAANIVSIDSVAVYSPEILSSGTGEGTAEWRDNSKDRTLATTEYSLAGNVLTIVPATTGLAVAITYRAKTGGKAWVRVHKHLGSPAGFTATVAGPIIGGTTLQTASGGVWGITDELRGVPGVVVTIEYDESGAVWAAGIPQNVTLLVRGMKLYDPTKDSTNGGSGEHRLNDSTTWEFSNCAALCWREYLRRELSCGAAEIDDASVRAAVPICKTQVTLLAGGTQDAFTCDGMISTADTWADNIERLSMTMIGNSVLIGNVWTLVPFGWEAPILSLPESSTAMGDIDIDSRPGLDEIINSVRGRCMDERPTAESPSGLFAMEEFPPRQIAAYLTEDEGIPYWHDVEFPLTRNFERAQRMAIFYAHQARQATIVKGPFNTDAYETRPGKRVRLPWASNGWNFTQDGGTGKVFKILERTVEPPGRVILTLKEDGSAIYSWDYTAAVAVDPTPQTALAPPNYVESVRLTEIRADSTTFIQRSDGTIVGYAAFIFERPLQDDVYVILYWKRAKETEFRQVRGRVGDTQLNAEGVTAGEVLNAFLVAYNGLGAPSTPTWVPVFTTGNDVPSSWVLSVENELKGVTFEYGIGDVTAVGVGVSSALVFAAKHPTAGYFVPGPVSSAWLYATTTASGTGQFAKFVWPRVPVIGGATYALYASLIAWECAGQMAVEWFDAAGNFLGAEGTDAVAGVPVESANARWDNVAHYTFRGRFVTAPAAARYAEVSARAVGSWTTHPEKHVSIYKPFFGRVPSSSALFPPWNAGPVSMVGTNFIAPNSTFELYEDARPSGVIAWQTVSDAFTPGLPTVWVPSSANIEHGALLRVHYSVTIALTGRTGAGSFTDIAAGLSIYDRPVDASGAAIEPATNGVNPTDDPTTGGSVYYGSLIFGGMIFDQHFSSARLLDGLTFTGTVTWSQTYRWIKGAGRRFGLVAAFTPSNKDTSKWQIALAASSRMTVEVLKR